MPINPDDRVTKLSPANRRLMQATFGRAPTDIAEWFSYAQLETLLNAARAAGAARFVRATKRGQKLDSQGRVVPTV